MKRSRLTILVLSLLSLVLAACGGVPPTTAMTPASTGPQKIKVTIGEFYIHASQTTFITGTKYQFVVTNGGTHYHNFLIMRPMETMAMTVPDLLRQSLGNLRNIAPNETRTLNFTFDHIAPAGTLEFSCHYGGHYEMGMHQAIVVNTPAGASVSPYPNNTNSHTSTNTDLCDPVTTTTIANGVYTPANISLKAGDTLMITNPDSQSYTPMFSQYSRQIVTIGSPNNTKYVYIPFPGTFTLSSKEHPEAKATISVSKAAGNTCGMTPTAVSFDANYSDPKNRYSFTSAQVSIKKGQRIRLSNLIDQDLTFSITPDIGLGKILITKDWSQDLEFMTKGTYTISSAQFPNEQITVNVQGT